jgi:hypothetical protein
MRKRSPKKGDSGGWKMKHQTTLENDQMENIVVLEEEETEKSENEEFWLKGLEDLLYEEWRDNKAITEERK